MSFKEFLKAMRIIHLALAAGIAVYIIITIFLVYSGGMGFKEEGFTEMFMIVIPIFVLSALVASVVVVKRKLEALNKNYDSFEEKVAEYRSILIIKYALIEGPAFFAIVAYMLTEEDLFIIAASIILGYLILLRPSKSTIAKDLNMRETDLD